MITITVTDYELSKTLNGISKYSQEKKKQVADRVQRGALNIDKSAKNYLHSYIKGNPMNVIKRMKIVPSGDRLNARVISEHKASIYLEMGTKPHEIRPVRANALRFKTPTIPNVIGIKAGVTKKGQRYERYKRAEQEVVFTKRVHHPGTKKIPFMKASADREKPKFIQDLKDILK